MKNIKTIIIGAGPAGLAAALELVRHGHQVTIIERENRVGGLSRTEEYKGYHFDVGGHRFFTKEEEVKNLWQKVLGKDFLKRPRLSRIYYDKKFFYYPLKPMNALKNIGILKSIVIFFSYLATRLKAHLGLLPKPESFEEWVTQKFGKKLFNIFFKTYTEKVWGISTSKIGAEWAAQRIKGLSLSKAVINAFFPKKGKVTTLIDEFNYPRLGPGMMYTKIAELVKSKGGEILLNTKVIQIRSEGDQIRSITIKTKSGETKELVADYFISSIPLSKLIKSLVPKPAEDILQANRFLKFRSFLTVCLIIDNPEVFPDNWIYIHDPEVKVGRIQNFKNWSPDMVPDISKTALGLEYFCFEGDDLWNSPNEKLIRLAGSELEKIGLGKTKEVIDGFVIRQKDAYPIYEIGYRKQLEKVYDFIKQFKNLQIIGRAGLFRYNNMDHSILTGLYAARNILGQNFDIFRVNTKQEYHEIKNS
jgi:protoporphyrinogen oxidase